MILVRKFLYGKKRRQNGRRGLMKSTSREKEILSSG